jgi:hypothetical protein
MTFTLWITLSGIPVVDSYPYCNIRNIWRPAKLWTHYVIKRNLKMFKSAVTFNTDYVVPGHYMYIPSEVGCIYPNFEVAPRRSVVYIGTDM